MNTMIKICGLTNIDDALMAVSAGANAIGFIFSDSPRRMNPGKVRQIIDALPPFICSVGVFADESAEWVNEISTSSGISVVQLQGKESPIYCRQIHKPVIKTFHIRSSLVPEDVNNYDVSAYLFDTYSCEMTGGTGRAFDWELLNNCVFSRPIIIAGGLNENNVGTVISRLNPYGVDVSSGVSLNEQRKDPLKISKFISAVRHAAPKLQSVMSENDDILSLAFQDCPLVEIKGRKFLINSFTEQVPATPAALLHTAARRVCEKLKISPDMKLVGEEDKGGAILAAVSLLTGLPYGIARWYPSGLEGQVEIDFKCEYASGSLYLNGVDAGDRVIIVDDLISTGGTLISLIEAVRNAGATIEQIICVAEKTDYGGVEYVRNMTGLAVETLVQISVSGKTSTVVSLNYSV